MNETLYNAQVEQAVLGSLIIDPESYYHLSAFLRKEDFYIVKHQWIWGAIAALIDARMDVDMITIASELDRMGLDYGGAGYLTSLLNEVVTSLNAISYGRIVEAFAKRRALVTMANNVAQIAHSDKPIDEIMGAAQIETAKATERGGNKRVTSKEAASAAIDAITGHPRFFKFGIKNLDDRLSGIFPYRLYIWAGYQGSGKSAFKIQNARVNAEAGYKVMLVSLEMSAAQIWLRMACGDLGIDMDNVLSGRVDPDTIAAVTNQAGILGDQYQDRIIIYAAPMSLQDINAAAKRENPDIIWIDHSGLISGKPREMDALAWAGYIPQYLRQNISLAGRSVHLLQQLNRSATKENRRPTQHDIRMAGNDAPDMITLLYRPEDQAQPIGKPKVEFITDKNRFGWTGTEDVIFDLPHQRFLATVNNSYRV